MSATEYQVVQTDKREWRAQVWHAGKWHGIGYRDNQADALKAATRVYWSLRGEWSGQLPTDDKPTEGMAKMAVGGLENRGSSRNKMATRYPSMGATVTRPINGNACARCGGQIFGRHAQYCSPACKQAAYRERQQVAA